MILQLFLIVWQYDRKEKNDKMVSIVWLQRIIALWLLVLKVIDYNINNKDNVFCLQNNSLEVFEVL